MRFLKVLSAYLNLNRGAVALDINRAVLFNNHRLDAVVLKLVEDAFCGLHVFTFSSNDKCIFIFLDLSFLILLYKLIKKCYGKSK